MPWCTCRVRKEDAVTDAVIVTVPEYFGHRVVNSFCRATWHLPWTIWNARHGLVAKSGVASKNRSSRHASQHSSTSLIALYRTTSVHSFPSAPVQSPRWFGSSWPWGSRPTGTPSTLPLTRLGNPAVHVPPVFKLDASAPPLACRQ